MLSYADIIGLTAVMGKGFYYIQFLTSTGKPMTIHPTFSQLQEDERLWEWLQTVPKSDGSRSVFLQTPEPVAGHKLTATQVGHNRSVTNDS